MWGKEKKLREKYNKGQICATVYNLLTLGLLVSSYLFLSCEIIKNVSLIIILPKEKFPLFILSIFHHEFTMVSAFRDLNFQLSQFMQKTGF